MSPDDNGCSVKDSPKPHQRSLFADIKAAVQAEDATALRYAVITLKGSASNLGLRKMDRLCVQLQQFGDRGYFEEAATVFFDLQE